MRSPSGSPQDTIQYRDGARIIARSDAGQSEKSKVLTSVFTGPSACLPAMRPKAFRVATEMTLPLQSGSVTTISGSGGFFEMTRVFISYRRDDTAGQAGRVHDRLTGEFGDNNVFMDVDNIPLGADFTKVLGDEVAKCDVLLR
jgi:hypothetical protein